MIVGVDFGGPKSSRDQQKKIIAIAAQATDSHCYRIDRTGINERLLSKNPPGWSAEEFCIELLEHPVRVAAFDFPFSVPDSLLSDSSFAAEAGYKDGAFLEWRSFNRFVAQRLPIRNLLDFGPFAVWCNPAERARLWTKRDTDVAAGGQPPLKDKFQSTFQMMLLGNALLSRLWESQKYRVLPFPGGSGAGEVIEVYPGATLRQWGLPDYKGKPAEAIQRGISTCAATGIKLEVDDGLRAFCCSYQSPGKGQDHDAADAFIALCTAILYAEGACHPATTKSDPTLMAREGVIWVPDKPQ